MSLQFAPQYFFVFALIQSVVLLLLIRFLDLYEREPLSILALMAVWGAVGATFLSMAGNGLVLTFLYLLSPDAGTVFAAAISAPLVEETAKGLALVVVFGLSYLAAKRFGGLEFSGVTDGIVYGAAVGLGFAFSEDLFYFLSDAFRRGVSEGLDVYAARVGFFGIGQLGHAVYTGVFGAGLGLATWSRGWVARICYPLLGLAAAMLMHAIHNGIGAFVLVARFGLENAADYLGGGVADHELARRMSNADEAAFNLMRFFDYGFLALFFVAIGLWLWYQRRVVREELAEEAKSGLISREEHEIMPRYWRRSTLYWRVLWSGRVERWRALRRLHNEMVDLAFLKRRVRKTNGDPEAIEKRRQRITALKTQRIVD